MAAPGALGPRLVGRLTAELILRSPQYMNCVQYYEIDLRGNKIGVIENLGATQNQFDSIDLSDNAIVKVEGFPRLQRLKCLLLNNNRVTKIARHLEASIPALEMLVLTNNKIANLADLDPLETLPALKYLSLADCPVTKVKNYRLYLISLCPNLKMLDFKKVKQKEREVAARMFPRASAGDAPAENGGSAKTAAKADVAKDADEAGADADMAEDGDATAKAGPGSAPSADQLTAIKAAIANAQTLEEVQRLEAALKEGYMPSEKQVGEEPMAED